MDLQPPPNGHTFIGDVSMGSRGLAQLGDQYGCYQSNLTVNNVYNAPGKHSLQFSVTPAANSCSGIFRYSAANVICDPVPSEQRFRQTTRV